MGNNIKIPFGIYKGQIIYISSAVPGDKYECCECGGELIPIISNKIASHFRHKIECKCDGGVSRVGGESPIHKYAKKVIQEEKKVYIDEDNFIELREVKEEYKINSTERIVDLYCVTNDYREIVIEIFYKHKVESEKVQELKDNKIRNVLEINIPDITNFRDENEIRKGVIKNFVRDMLINTDFTEENRWRKEKLDEREIDLNKREKEMKKEKREHIVYIQEKYKKIKNMEYVISKQKSEIDELKQEEQRIRESINGKYELSELDQEKQRLRELINEMYVKYDILLDQYKELEKQTEKMKSEIGELEAKKRAFEILLKMKEKKISELNLEI